MGGKYRAYPEYKDSGVEWPQKIPRHWINPDLKHLAKIKNGQDYKHIESSTGYPVIGSGGTFAFATDYMYNKESVLLGRKGTIDVPLYVTHPFWTVDTMYYTEIRSDFCSKLLYYLATTIPFEKYSTNTALPSMTQEHLGNYSFPVPLDFEEQQQIAKFLDYETAKMDRLIEKQQELIELLKEKRQAVISHAVTKGLNPDAPLKPSGIEWLGDVPAHWEVRSISKSTIKITNGYVGPTRDILVEKGIPYIQATHVKEGRIKFDNAYFVAKKWSESHQKSILVGGDVLVVQTGAGTGDVGLVTIDEEGFNCHALIILQPNKKVISGAYLSLVLQSNFGYSVLFSIRTGGMHPHLNCSEVKFVKIPIPSQPEQKEIVRFIRNQTELYEKLILKQQYTIALLQERRTALISAAVTGKIDVRDWQPPASDAEGAA